MKPSHNSEYIFLDSITVGILNCQWIYTSCQSYGKNTIKPALSLTQNFCRKVKLSLIADSIYGLDDIFIDSSVYAQHAFNFISCRASRIDYMRDF